MITSQNFTLCIQLLPRSNFLFHIGFTSDVTLFFTRAKYHYKNHDAPASTSTTATATGNEEVTLADEIKKYDTEGLISFLQERDLGLDLDDENIIRKEKITGRDFLKTTKDEFRSIGLAFGPSSRLAEFSKECKEKKLRSLSSYRSLKKVLTKYGIDSNGRDYPTIYLKTRKIQDDDKYFKHCMENILFRMKHYGSLVVDSLESMRNEYVSCILHTSLHIAGDVTNKEFSMRPEFEIIGEESSGRVDYAIKEAENLICVTEDKVQRGGNVWHCDHRQGLAFLLNSPGEISQASELPLAIKFNKKALVKESEEYQTLCNGVKKVLEMVVGMIIDRACAEEEPDRKRLG
ncbi:hypothetical protein GLOIN_2v1587390 [Rhizophagus clarus]|uniref:SAM domain-containing protein n=1 Tax=Rhizophagus clarus TaxID=94130 RepID=A0A8H3LS20_9GLOM|nr:hypothetical protein GLOIN_2v1587390 [Rhizophagus clarus]